MTPQEFLERYVIAIIATFSCTQEEMVRFGQGFHLALMCMSTSPEWGQAALRLLDEDDEQGSLKTKNVAEIFMGVLPIDHVDQPPP